MWKRAAIALDRIAQEGDEIQQWLPGISFSEGAFMSIKRPALNHHTAYSWYLGSAF
jgi:hypothetical protein